jgi:hypothetical protein
MLTEMGYGVNPSTETDFHHLPAYAEAASRRQARPK